MAVINKRMFKDHSVCAISTTKADVTGVSVCDIMKLGQWSNNSIFQKFYKKDILIKVKLLKLVS